MLNYIKLTQICIGENPKVRKAVQDIMTFWLEEGIDGFRVRQTPYAIVRPI